MLVRKITLLSFAFIVSMGIIVFFTISTQTDVEISQIPIEPTKEEKDSEHLAEISQTNEILDSFSPKYIPKEKQCTGNARCISGFVTRVIDGDTIVVGDKSIRFALVNTPEWGDYDYTQARNYIETICPVGSKVLVDEDDGQTQGSFGRIIAKIYCNELILNEEILEVGHAIILPEFCKVSEFAQDSWAKNHGC